MEQTLGKRIAAHRKRLGLTQDALAEKLGITAQAVSKWENDLSCPDISILPKLAEIFSISTDELLGMNPPKKVHDAEVVDEDDDSMLNFSFHSKDDSNGKWEFHWDSGRKNGICSAVCVLLVGVLYLLAKWFSWDVSFWEILWPTVLLTYGMAGVFPKFSLLNLGIGLIGIYFLLQNIGYLQLEFASKLIFPLCILLFGLSLLLKALQKPKHGRFRVKHHGDGDKKMKYTCQAVGERFDCDLCFGEKVYEVAVPMLAGGKAEVSFGILTIDLQGCEELRESCSIDVNCAFGELRLLVPKYYAVQSHNSTAFGNIKILGQPDPNPRSIIQLDADAAFGQITIEYV